MQDVFAVIQYSNVALNKNVLTVFVEDVIAVDKGDCNRKEAASISGCFNTLGFWVWKWL